MPLIFSLQQSGLHWSRYLLPLKRLPRARVLQRRRRRSIANYADSWQPVAAAPVSDGPVSPWQPVWSWRTGCMPFHLEDMADFVEATFPKHVWRLEFCEVLGAKTMCLLTQTHREIAVVPLEGCLWAVSVDEGEGHCIRYKTKLLESLTKELTATLHTTPLKFVAKRVSEWTPQQNRRQKINTVLCLAAAVIVPRLLWAYFRGSSL